MLITYAKAKDKTNNKDTVGATRDKLHQRSIFELKEYILLYNHVLNFTRHKFNQIEEEIKRFMRNMSEEKLNQCLIK
jgi:hypothetical protein